MENSKAFVSEICSANFGGTHEFCDCDDSMCPEPLEPHCVWCCCDLYPESAASPEPQKD
jgi:hypothetical protein